MGESWRGVLSEVIARRAEPRFGAAVRRGISATTEVYAYPYVLPRLGTLNLRDAVPVLRVCGLAATFKEIPQDQNSRASVRSSTDEIPLRKRRSRTLGRHCIEASKILASRHGRAMDPTKPDAIAARLRLLESLDLEQSVEVIRGVLALTEPTGVALDFFELAKMLIHWGDGISTESQFVRRQVLRDYYSAFYRSPESPTTTPDSKEQHVS